MTFQAALMFVFLVIIALWLITEVVALYFENRRKGLPPPERAALRHPEVDDHWIVEDGQYRYEENGDGH